MALSRFWTFIIVASIISLLYSVFSGQQFTLDTILTGNTRDDDKLKRRMVIAEFSPEELKRNDAATYQTFNETAPGDNFQKSLKKTKLFAFVESAADSIKGQIYFWNYIDQTNKGYITGYNKVFTNLKSFNESKTALVNAPENSSANFIFCASANSVIHLDSVTSNSNTINDSVLLRRYNMAPLPGKVEGILSRMLRDENALICTRDTVFDMKASGNIQVSTQPIRTNGILQTCSWVVTDLWIPLLGILVFLCGLMNLLKESKVDEKLARFLSPFFKKIFPELRDGHPAYNYMTLNFAANFLGLDNAATPFGLKAMESMQEDNVDKDKASNSQIMFLCLHAAGLTLIPTSIIGYRAVMNASNPADVMLPIIITSFMGTLAALIFVSIKQKINLFNKPVVLVVLTATVLFSGLFVYIHHLSDISKNRFTGNLGVGIFLFIIAAILTYCFINEKIFTKNGSNIFASFVEGAKEGITTAFRILPYMIAMLVAISIFRNSGLMNSIMDGITALLSGAGVSRDITNALPVALLRPFSAGGARGFMFDAMQQYGADSFTGRLACLFEGAAETTFYVIAIYFGSVNVKDTRYSLSVMLLADLVCVLTAIVVCSFWFR